MVKQIKNWDKLDGKTFGHNGSIYLITHAVRCDYDENVYMFNIHPTLIKGSLTISDDKYTPYKLKLELFGMANSKFSMQTAIQTEELKDFSIFCEILRELIQKMLNKIEQEEEFDIHWLRDKWKL